MPDANELDEKLKNAAKIIRGADALLIGAGAGMGVDSGLPDFRGNEGFWKAYPPFRGKSFSEISNPYWFRNDPEQAWGFFGHRMHLYRETNPHPGFEILKRWGERAPFGYFVFTSNVDGQFQKAGFAEHLVLECHGSIHYLQCSKVCRDEIWRSDDVQVDVDMQTVRARSTLPICPKCKAVARPNILMFGDYEWLETRCEDQQVSYTAWLASVRGKRVVAIELGAGLAIPTVRSECEDRSDCLIRINPREAEVSTNGISLPMKALEALTLIDDKMTG
jgi:NAD-dependent SIR2 family protein deacetylase